MDTFTAGLLVFLLMAGVWLLYRGFKEAIGTLQSIRLIVDNRAEKLHDAILELKQEIKQLQRKSQ